MFGLSSRNTSFHAESQLTNSSYIFDIQYGLLTKQEVKMAGYWPRSVLLCL